MTQDVSSSSAVAEKSDKSFRILSLDGGGAKGFYTLGVLSEIEAMIGRPLCERFDLIFGTSTGAIIAALLALGYGVADVHALYKKHVPTVMRSRNPSQKSKALTALAKAIFGTSDFTQVETDVGIVATRWAFERPMIFKSSPTQTHGRAATFVPGFGCTIAEAVVASCSAYPFFKKAIITTSRGDEVELIDGGYCANNPTLYAIADALMAMEKAPEDLRVVSVGVGAYPEPAQWGLKGWTSWLKKRIVSIQLLQKTLNVNTASMEQLRSILFSNIRTVRINDTFERPEMATDLMESDPKKLGLLYQSGSQSFANYEAELREILSVMSSDSD